MTYSIVVLNGAKEELRTAVDYLARVLGSPKAAKGLLDELDAKVELIRQNPELFALSPLPELRAKGYRKVFIGNYILLYTVRDATVYLAHFFHQTQDYAKLV